MKKKLITITSALLAISIYAQTCPNNNHPHAIDLGLPSGTKWACCNVGATKPEANGGYFAWGETEEKDIYNDVTYFYCIGEDVNGDGLYIGENEYFEDLGSNICGTKYDVVHIKWGGSWKMPTQDQYEELIYNCKDDLITVNGVVGHKFISRKNGKCIFFPAAGERSSSLYDVGIAGSYWLSTHPTGNGRWAEYFGWRYSGVELHAGYRSHGLSVRPVTLNGPIVEAAAADAGVEAAVGTVDAVTW